jgi:hypothetical protein
MEEDAAFRSLSLSTDRDDTLPNHDALTALVAGKA